jgi:multiple sugar transport system ATP-binding protein
MASIRAEKLVKRYGAFQAVHGIDFEIADGEFVAILGRRAAENLRRCV